MACRVAILVLLVAAEMPSEHLQPNNILFQSTAGGHMGGEWIWPVLFVLAGLGFGGLSAQAALHKGRQPLPAFLCGFLLLLPGYLYVATRASVAGAAGAPPGLGKIPLTRAPVPCPACGMANHPSAAQCPGCGAALTPTAKSEVKA